MLPGRTRPALSTLEEMEQEAASLPAAVPETEGLTALINKAEEWKAKSAALAAQGAPLKKMREVLHMGLRMPVEVPQLEALRAEIRRREWEDTAKKVCSIVESIGCFTRPCMQRRCFCLLLNFQAARQTWEGHFWSSPANLKGIQLCLPQSL